MALRPISQKFPALAPLIVESKRLNKQFSTTKKKFELEKIPTQDLELANFQRLFKHKSVLRRQLGDSDPHLQDQKIINLQLAAPHFDEVVIAPGQVFSFWKLLGRPTKQRGFVEGMLISNGRVVTGVGGGLCQLANLLYWIFLHSPLQVVEHHHHQLDIFPDSGRVLPFGSGASVFYNYIDLQVTNPTTQKFILKVWVDDTFLHGELWSDQPWPYSYTVQEENHGFYKSEVNGNVFRKNELYQLVIDKMTGNTIDKRLITKNNSQVLYPVAFA